MKTLRFLMVAALTLLVSCKEDTPPVVETLSATIVDATHATLTGNVSDVGYPAATSRGFCWAFTANPTISDHFSQNSSGSGTFTEIIEIVPDSTYYVRAYAINEVGTVYGGEVTCSTFGTFTGTMTDSRDGHIYRWVVVGDQTWMAENLAYLTDVFPPAEGGYQERFYYVQGYMGRIVSEAIATENYRNYGVLYNWKAVQTACPSGWRLPSDADWMVLEEHLGVNSSELEETGYRVSGNLGEKMKSTSLWFEEGNGKNSSGLNITPGGARSGNGEFTGIGLGANFRTGTTGGSTFNFSRGFKYDNASISRGTGVHNLGLSARCIKN